MSCLCTAQETDPKCEKLQDPIQPEQTIKDVLFNQAIDQTKKSLNPPFNPIQPMIDYLCTAIRTLQENVENQRKEILELREEIRQMKKNTLKVRGVNVAKIQPMKCYSCGKQDDTVSTRACGYAADVNNNPNCYETICDACEHEHIQDI